MNKERLLRIINENIQASEIRLLAEVDNRINARLGKQEPKIIIRNETLDDIILRTMPQTPPPENLEGSDTENSYATKGIAKAAREGGWHGADSSVSSSLSNLWRAGKIERRPTNLISKVRKNGKTFEKVFAGYHYWRKVPQ